jgi:hypothetical protein
VAGIATIHVEIVPVVTLLARRYNAISTDLFSAGKVDVVVPQFTHQAIVAKYGDGTIDLAGLAMRVVKST